ncbi:hypothetical protein A3F07_02315 [candidate division WWE3 bacterium RIFCSPHIGHO2_12_FULL_38_15]|uniref:PIN domain-containing protein n=1 Tax=candidate division WWE3 bacterium RIFCSPHIGHO2_02_FULL_38_14 TaxID=1802620 RepID=A0A1F4VAS0_UNCKA|nr:MAG: hypothetical protein A2793_00995 [candidate division WWE3 bacterium RIFCSPHIGHO2_01_FULL_38_45]OGC49576.1 MAG: hypothetical protein A3F07_02315 [candidate division WWE3 bacterium RIFCSPHIGHO2_12_FULL_38_15]OGC53372.1 MAG: hypothetical protein A3B64_00560 [candidate division WWE3 bacterium RIFCSPLOWO2_01_FULL_37_24]OGC54238.1 MAG: hypothetical protein A3D91_01690 [candidate division WWE3 bacterium RIFCSPHIGHO2_02_FULL_38_14]
MTDSVLLDTSVIIDFLRAKNRNETKFYKLAEKGVNLYISILTYAELHAGKSVWENQKALYSLQKILSGLTVIYLTEVTAREAGRIRATYKLDLIDSIIAATALEKDISLATLNTKHFTKVTGLNVIRY